jgi:hypothetical protein
VGEDPAKRSSSDGTVPNTPMAARRSSCNASQTARQPRAPAPRGTSSPNGAPSRALTPRRDARCGPCWLARVGAWRWRRSTRHSTPRMPASSRRSWTTSPPPPAADSSAQRLRRLRRLHIPHPRCLVGRPRRSVLSSPGAPGADGECRVAPLLRKVL